MFDSYLLILIGAFIVIITSFDFFYTTLSFNGAGFINKLLTAALSSFFLFLNKKTSTRTVLKFSGLSHILLSMLLWICLLWLGLFLILSGSGSSIVHADSKEAANHLNILYFSGYVLSTMGNGDFIPTSNGWQVVVAIFSFSGFIFITTGISYVINLTSAILHKRSLALYISNLGGSPEEIITNMYNNGSFDVLNKRISVLQEKINVHNQNHFAYPISHYFYSISKTESLAVNLTNLDEALTIIQHLNKKDVTTEKDVKILQDTIYNFLDTLQYSFITKLEDHEDISPNFKSLKEHKIPVSDPLVNNKRDSDSFIEKRRSFLAGFLKSSGWSWKDVYGEN